MSIRGLTAQILFVDFGNKQDTHISKLKTIVPRFMMFPKLVMIDEEQCFQN
jgi:hypothetical protein